MNNAEPRSYREWFEERNVFCREVKLYFGQCDLKRRISLPELLLLTSDTAVEDYRLRGMSVDELAAEGVVILVSRASYEIHAYPEAGDTLLVKTWEDKPEGILLSRKYEIESADGKSLISGTSLWLIAEPATRRIVKPAAFTVRPAPDFAIPVDCPPCAKLRRPDGMKAIAERKVMFSDVDSNGHTNNSRYAAFALDILPSEFQEGDIKNITINYAKEARLGDVIELSAAFSDDGKTATVAGDVEGRACFEERITLK